MTATARKLMVEVDGRCVSEAAQAEPTHFVRFMDDWPRDAWKVRVCPVVEPGEEPPVALYAHITYEEVMVGRLDSLIDSLTVKFPGLAFGGFHVSYVEYP